MRKLKKKYGGWQENVTLLLYLRNKMKQFCNICNKIELNQYNNIWPQVNNGKINFACGNIKNAGKDVSYEDKK